MGIALKTVVNQEYGFSVTDYRCVELVQVWFVDFPLLLNKDLIPLLQKKWLVELKLTV